MVYTRVVYVHPDVYPGWYMGTLPYTLGGIYPGVYSPGGYIPGVYSPDGYPSLYAQVGTSLCAQVGIPPYICLPVHPSRYTLGCTQSPCTPR